MHSTNRETAELAAGALLAAVGGLVEQSLTRLPDGELVELLRGVERAARMLAAVQHRVLIEWIPARFRRIRVPKRSNGS